MMTPIEILQKSFDEQLYSEEDGWIDGMGLLFHNHRKAI